MRHDVMTEQRRLAGVEPYRAALHEAKGEDWSAAEFCRQLEKRLRPKLGDRILRCDHFNKFNKKHDTIHVTFINLPEGGAGGARGMNNRAIFEIAGFGPGESDPAPKGKVKFSTQVWSFDGHLWNMKRPRGATGAPGAILEKLVKAIEAAAALEPNLR